MLAIDDILGRLGLDRGALGEGDLEVRTPITGEGLARIARTDAAGTDAAVARASAAFERVARRAGPAPRRARAAARRGAAQREGGARRARHPRDRQDRPGGPRRGPGDDRHLRLRGRALAPALRPHDRLRAARHRMLETWHPLGPVGVISAFNFPVAVWSWNAALALVCGDPVVWKPSSARRSPHSPASALWRRAALQRDQRPAGPAQPLIGGSIGEPGWPRTRAAAALRHRLDVGWARGRAGGRRPVRPHAARARRQQRHDRHARRRPRPGAAGDPVRRRRHRRPALHHLRRLIVHESIAEEMSGASRRLRADPHRDPLEPER